MLDKSLFGCGAMLLLSACGGTTQNGAAATIDITANQTAGGSATIAVGTDQASGDTTLTFGTTTFTLADASILNRGTFSGKWRSTGSTTQQLLSNGTYSAAQVVTFQNDGKADVTTRYSSSDTPLRAPNGTAQASGTYVGYFPHIAGFIHRGSTGDVNLTLTFADSGSTLSGTITNRTTTRPNTGVADQQYGVFSDLTLPPVTIAADGTFSGATSAGFLNTGTTSERIATGAFEGIVAGPDGTEVVGAISIDYAFPSSTVKEFGVFAAGHAAPLAKQ